MTSWLRFHLLLMAVESALRHGYSHTKLHKSPVSFTVYPTQQIQPRKHRALHRSQPEHPAALHPAGAHDRRRHEELSETEQTTSGTSALQICVCVSEVCFGFVCFFKLSCAVSRVRPHHLPCGSCCGWPETSPAAVATWRRTISYTGSHAHPDITAEILESNTDRGQGLGERAARKKGSCNIVDH